ncbi:MAG: hypothetical protein KDA44_12645 [Planctomycetales bacterium]|nr:hypothetical protein [Planctomycetales bacterium]
MSTYGSSGALLAPCAEGMICNRCNRELPLRIAEAGEHAAVWQCVECGIPFPAICIPDRLPALGDRVALDDRHFDTSYLPPISTDTRAEIVRMAAHESDGYAPEKRRSRRVAVALLAAGVELDEQFYPISPTFQMMVVNVSAGGLGMVNMGRITAPFIACKLRSSYRAEPIQVIVRVVRQRELRSPYIEIGGEFVVRLGSVAK